MKTKRPALVWLAQAVLFVFMLSPIASADFTQPIRWLIDPKPLGLDPSRTIDATSQRLHGLLYERLGEKWAAAHGDRKQLLEITQCVAGYRTGPNSAFRETLAPFKKIEFQSELGRLAARLHYFVTSRGICMSPAPGETPQSSGAYQVSQQTADRWVLQPRQPGLPPLELIWIGDETAKLHALLSGEIDLAMSALGISKTRWIIAHKQSEWITPLVSGWPLQYIALNTQIAPLNDPQVRRSLRDAIDRGRVLRTWLRGFGERRDTYFATQDPIVAEPTLTTRLDGVELNLRTSPQREASELAKILRNIWESAGAKVHLEVVELGLLLAAIRSGKVPISISHWVGEPSWAHLKRVLHSRGDQNRARYNNPQVDVWIDQALEQRTSPALRLQLAKKIQKAWDRDVPYILLWTWKQGLFARRAAFSPEAQKCLERWNSPGAEWRSVLACLR